MCFLLLPFHFPFHFCLCVCLLVWILREVVPKMLFWLTVLSVDSCGFLSDCFWIVCLAFGLGSFWIPEACLWVLSCCRLSLLQLRVFPTVSFFSGRGSLFLNFSMCSLCIFEILELAFPILLSEPQFFPPFVFHSFSQAGELLSILICYFCMLV